MFYITEEPNGNGNIVVSADLAGSGLGGQDGTVTWTFIEDGTRNGFPSYTGTMDEYLLVLLKTDCLITILKEVLDLVQMLLILVDLTMKTLV